MKLIKGLAFVLIAIVWLSLILATAAIAVGNQNNTSGSNTAIEGNYTGGSTTYESGSTSSSTTTNNSTSNIKSAPYSANAPSLNSMNNCGMGISGSVQTFGVGVATGKHYIDQVCETINLSKALHGMGMKVAAISVLCQNEQVFIAMSAAFANTPCPINGKIGSEATKVLFKNYNGKMPTYEQYLKIELKKIEEAKAAQKIETSKNNIKKIEPIKLH
tara:strand:- start:492 stop:1142 length:651 start_codon:yes stop_codon:yes gene_type:complete